MLTAWDAVPPLDRMFDDVMRSIAGTATNTKAFDPAIDVRANDEAVVFVCDVPGFKQEDLDVTLENHELTIQGTRKYEGNPDERVLVGRAYGAFKRVFALPESLDEASLEAKLEDGVLTIRIPKQPKAKPRKIQIGK
jgi:HSP20 family protein